MRLSAPASAANIIAPGKKCQRQRRACTHCLFPINTCPTATGIATDETLDWRSSDPAAEQSRPDQTRPDPDPNPAQRHAMILLLTNVYAQDTYATWYVSTRG